MQERTSKLVFWMFFGGLILIVAGNMADYYVSGSHIGTILTVIGFVVWAILLVMKFFYDKKNK